MPGPIAPVNGGLPYLCRRLFVYISRTESRGLWISTYNYYIWPDGNGIAWQVPQPALDKPDNIKGIAPIWGCFTRIKNGNWDGGHGQSEGTMEPTGLNSGMSDGSARWFDWKDAEKFWQYGEAHYWPKYRE